VNAGCRSRCSALNLGIGCMTLPCTSNRGQSGQVLLDPNEQKDVCMMLDADSDYRMFVAGRCCSWIGLGYESLH